MSRSSRRAAPAAERSRSSRRSVDILVEHTARSGRADGLVFGSKPETPFQPSNLWRRARRAWKRSGFQPIGVHEARHTFASVLIAAGVNAKAITTYMGHASIQTTYDLCGKVMPGSESEAAALVDAYLARAESASRIAQLDESRS